MTYTLTPEILALVQRLTPAQINKLVSITHHPSFKNIKKYTDPETGIEIINENYIQG